jgi:hypothetical protein
VDRWIQSWNEKQILAYDKQVAEREELHRKCDERERGKDDGFTTQGRLVYIADIWLLRLPVFGAWVGRRCDRPGSEC